MRINISNNPSGYNPSLSHYKKAILLIILVLVFVALKPFEHLCKNLSFLLQPQNTKDEVSVHDLYEFKKPHSPSQYIEDDPNNSLRVRLGHKCNIFRGKWVPYPKGPLYTNRTECDILEGQNCMMFGRPDTEFLKWRWKPDECELPLFDAARFLELVRGKSMTFIGDSLARNQMQSLGCLLRSVARPVNESSTNQRIRRLHYVDYNFTLNLLLTTHLVKAPGIDPLSVAPINLYLDEPDEIWATRVKNVDYVIISTGHWFSRPLIYHEKNKVVGCHMCHANNLTDFTRYFGYAKALQTAFRTLIDLQGFAGTIILRTITATHFEVEEWEGRGNCVKKRPLTKQEMKYDWYLEMFLRIQKEQFLAAKREGEERGLKFKLLDITKAMMLRPDGHPNHYGHPPGKKKRFADCLHWCLPGPIDTWNEFLLQMLKTEEEEEEDKKSI